MYLKNLWDFTRERNQRGKSLPMPSYISISFANLEIAHPKSHDANFATHVMLHCIRALVVNKLAANINSPINPVGGSELACLSTILGTESRVVDLCLSQPGTIELVNMISLAFDKVGTVGADTVPSDVLDVVQQTLGILSHALPMRTEIQLGQPIPIIEGSNGHFERNLLSHLLDLFHTYVLPTSPLKEEVRTCCLRMCLKGLWHFGRAFNQLGNKVPLPSSVSVTSSSLEMTGHICKHPDLSIRLLGHCARALVVNKLAADIDSRTDPIGNGELACISAILGTESRDIALSFSQPGAVAVANMISLMFDKVGTLAADTVPPDVLDVVQQTLETLSQSLPSPASDELQLDHPVAMVNGSDGKFEYILLFRLLNLLSTFLQVTSPFTEETTCCLRMCLRGLWYFGRAFIQLGHVVPLPPFVSVAFSDPGMTNHIREHPDLSTRVLGHCVWALIVNKLAADIEARAHPISEAELAFLSAILGPKSPDVTLCLNQPSAVAVANMISLTFGEFATLVADTVSPDMLDLVQQTLVILSEAPSSQEEAELHLDLPIPIIPVSDGKFERILLSRLLDLHKMCMQGSSRFDRNALDSCRRICMKGLWYFGRAFHEFGNTVPLPPCFIDPKLICHIPWIHDAVTREIARCVGALVVNKLVTDINSRDTPVSDLELTCLSAILHSQSDDVTRLLRHPGAVEFTNILFLASNNITLLSPNTMSPDVLDVVRQTFFIISRILPPELNPMTRLDTSTDVFHGECDSYSVYTIGV